MADDFSAVKERLSIAEYLTGRGVVKESRATFYNPSPCCNHNDCFTADENKNSFKCFSCDAGGSVIDLIMIFENCDLRSALEIGARLASVELSKPSGKKTKEEKVEPVRSKILKAAAKYYHEFASVENSIAIQHFCGKRGHEKSTFKKMQVGHSNGRLFHHLTEAGFSEAEIIDAGLWVTEKKGKKLKNPYDYFGVDHLTFPVYNHDGDCVGMTSKRIKKKPPYPPGKILGKIEWFINFSALGKFSEMFVVEGENDVASLIDAGYENVVGTAGGPGAEQFKLLRIFMSGKTVLLWFDGDEGGENHTRKLRRAMQGTDVRVKCLTGLQSGANDPDEFIQKLRVAGDE